MNFEKMNLVEMSSQEVKETSGGFLGFLVAAIIIVAAVIFANDGNDSTETYVNGIRVGN